VTVDGVWIGEGIYSPLTQTTQNYKHNATTNLHNSQITAAPAKLFSACCVFTSSSLAVASNSGDSSASCGQVLFSQRPV
jgi:streptolysin S family bacteriocin protoxin